MAGRSVTKNQGQTTSDEEIAAGLFHIAAAGDNVKKAAKESGISERQLHYWRTQHADRYARIRHEHLREIEAGLIHQFRDNALLSTELHRQATLKALEQAEAGTLEKPAQVAQQAAVAAGLAADKLLTFTDRPTQIVEHRDPASTVNALAQRLGIQVIDSSAEEMDDAGELDPGL